MYVRDVDIVNFKGIEQCHLSFQQGFNLLIGENGQGKTSILEAIAVGMGGFISGIATSLVRPRHFSMDEVRTVYQEQGDGGYSPEYFWPSVGIHLICQDREYSWIRVKRGANSRSTVVPRDICHIAEQLVYHDVESILPVISYQSAARVWAQKREKKYDFSRLVYKRESAYIDCLTDEASMKLLLNWCSRMEQIAWQKGKKIREYEAVKYVISQVMSRLQTFPVTVFYNKQSEELMCQMRDTMLPISALSAGYQSLIWMCLDIAYRMAVLNPSLKEHINKTPGVVLIDELDLHLHPQWQWKVIDALRYAFPNVQFIATTHSPIIISSAKNVQCIDIRDVCHVEVYANGYGLELQTILKSMQHTVEIPQQVQQVLHNFYKAIDAGNLLQAKLFFQQLEKEIASDNPILTKARETLELELEFGGE